VASMARGSKVTIVYQRENGSHTVDTTI
jgi:hypothetical protein